MKEFVGPLPYQYVFASDLKKIRPSFSSDNMFFYYQEKLDLVIK